MSTPLTSVTWREHVPPRFYAFNFWYNWYKPNAFTEAHRLRSVEAREPMQFCWMLENMLDARLIRRVLDIIESAEATCNVYIHGYAYTIAVSHSHLIAMTEREGGREFLFDRVCLIPRFSLSFPKHQNWSEFR